MRIWIVSEGEPLPSDGENVRLRRMGLLSTLMSEKGHEVHWFSSTFHHYKKIHRSNEDRIIKVNEKLKIHLIKTKGYKKNVSFARIIHHRKISKWMKKNNDNFEIPNIILTTLAPIELSDTMVKFAKKKRIPIVVDIRDLWPEIYYEVIPSWGSKIIKPYVFYNEKRTRKMLRDSTSIIGVTPKFLQYGLSIAGLEKRPEDKVFYTSYKPQDFSDDHKLFDKQWLKYNIHKSDFIITFLGNFGKQFNFSPIIQAAHILKDVPNIKFVLCGLGESFERIEEATESLKNVILPGWIEKEKINSLLSVSSLGIAPYRESRNFKDNTPNKFGEYLSASLPILLGIEGIMADLSKKYDSGLVYKDGEDLASQINYLNSNRNSVKQMSINAKQLYNEKFNADVVYNELSSFLESIAKNIN